MPKSKRFFWLVIMAAGLLGSGLRAERAEDAILAKVRQGIDSGKIAFRLTEPEEIIALLGRPEEEKQSPDGGGLFLDMKYGNLEFMFGKTRDGADPFTLRGVRAGPEFLDIGRGRRIVLRSESDLKKLDSFSGLENVSLEKLDLRDKRELIDRSNFDGLTIWPPVDRMPFGFNPANLLAKGRTPGLGIRALHRRGIDGRGVGVAIIDQPLLLGHSEYTTRLLRYDATGLDGFDAAMHGSAVASILVGETVGVAPAAALTYFAVPMWKNDNIHYVRALSRILEMNTSLPDNEKIRSVSISDGAFSGQPHFSEWQEVLKRAEDAGIMVVTCDPAVWRYGILVASPGGDADDPGQYLPSRRYCRPDDLIRIPGANRVVASQLGPDVRKFDREGGMSWGAPYIAGLAALAFQADPAATPKRIWQALTESVVRTGAGPMANPAGFLEKIGKK